MVRNVAALALVLATACGVGTKPTAESAAGGTFGVDFLVTVRVDGAGLVTSAPPGIRCGGGESACAVSFPAGSRVTLSQATAQHFNGWFGDCAGYACALSGNADKYVVASFSATPQAHPNFLAPAVHGPAAMTAALDCRSCHGVQLQGVGLAPGCRSCHVPPRRSGLALAVVSASIDGAARAFRVRFTVRDAAGKPLDLASAAEHVPMVGTLRVSLARVDVDARAQVLPYAVLTPPAPGAGAWAPGAITLPRVGAEPGASGALVQNAVGDYTYTSPGLLRVDAGKLAQTHVIWLEARRQENTAQPLDPRRLSVVNLEHAFVPAGGTAARRELVAAAACHRCHDGLRARPNAAGTGWETFHEGARVEGPYCGICHVPGGAADAAADVAVFVHRIHAARQLAFPASAQFRGITVTYPQDVRNCPSCHAGAAQGEQYRTRPTIAACGSCHFATDFTQPHQSSVRTDDDCWRCHDPTFIDTAHTPVQQKDPLNALDLVGTDVQTNAGAVVAAGDLPPFAERIAYVVDAVSAAPDATGALHPSIRFKLTRNGADVVFNAPPAVAPTTRAGLVQLMPNFVGAPAAHFVWAEPQDGLARPADFNRAASANLLNVFNKKVPGASLTGPDGGGWYTVTLAGATVPPGATMLTGGIGYAYELPTAAEFAAGIVRNQPLTQTNLPLYRYNAARGSGGLIVTAENAWKTAAGHGARRAVVATGKCNECHAFLGVRPNFHVGQRSDAPSCAWCHNPNLTRDGWSVNAATFVHAIHGARARTVPFRWNASCPGGSAFVADAAGGACRDAVSGGAVTPVPWYPAVQYPSSRCTHCHVEGSHDFTAAASAAALPNLLWTTVAAGTPPASVATSPYVTPGTPYGADATSPAALVNSPIAAACFACHDGPAARGHIEAGGGRVYVPRSAAGGAALVNGERCLECHGPAAIAPIADVHR